MSETSTVEPKIIEGTQTVVPEATKAMSEEEKNSDEFRPRKDSNLPEDIQREIFELHRENASRRRRSKELESELASINENLKKQDEDKLKEQGKLKELLDKKEKELSELKNVKNENETYLKAFEKQLNDIKKTLNKDQVELIEDSGWPLAKQLEWAQRFSKQSKTRSAAPDSARPGGEGEIKNIDIAEYSGPQGRVKLAKLRQTNPEKAKLIMELKNK
jgi:chromosome segregation ATPase